MSAVSKKLIPASSAASMMLWLVGSSVCQPKFIVPRARRLTFAPVRPRWAYCMSVSYVLTSASGRSVESVTLRPMPLPGRRYG